MKNNNRGIAHIVALAVVFVVAAVVGVAVWRNISDADTNNSDTDRTNVNSGADLDDNGSGSDQMMQHTFAMPYGVRLSEGVDADGNADVVSIEGTHEVSVSAPKDWNAKETIFQVGDKIQRDEYYNSFVLESPKGPVVSFTDAGGIGFSCQEIYTESNYKKLNQIDTATEGISFQQFEISNPSEKEISGNYVLMRGSNYTVEGAPEGYVQVSNLAVGEDATVGRTSCGHADAPTSVSVRESLNLNIVVGTATGPFGGMFPASFLEDDENLQNVLESIKL